MMDSKTFLKAFNRLIAPLKRKVQSIAVRGLIQLTKDSGDVQTGQLTLLADEIEDKVEFFFNYGHTSRPPKNSECVLIHIGGNKEHPIVVASNHRASRLKNLEEGDSALYNMNGKYLWLKKDDLFGLVSKIKIENEQHELISVLSEFMDEVEKGLTLTAIGPQPWDAITKQKLQAVKAKLDTFKKV